MSKANFACKYLVGRFYIFSPKWLIGSYLFFLFLSSVFVWRGKNVPSLSLCSLFYVCLNSPFFPLCWSLFLLCISSNRREGVFFVFCVLRINGNSGDGLLLIIIIMDFDAGISLSVTEGPSSLSPSLDQGTRFSLCDTLWF